MGFFLNCGLFGFIQSKVWILILGSLVGLFGITLLNLDLFLCAVVVVAIAGLFLSIKVRIFELSIEFKG